MDFLGACRLRCGWSRHRHRVGDLTFNPWFWLAILVLIAGAGATGYYKGSRHAQDAARASHATALESAIADANNRAQKDLKALIDHEWERQKVKTVFRDKIVTVERLIRENPSECRISDERFGLLNLAVDNANNRTAAP